MARVATALLVAAAIAAASATSPNMRRASGSKSMRLAAVDVSAAGKVSAEGRALMETLAEHGIRTYILDNGAVSMYSQEEVDEARAHVNSWWDSVSGAVTNGLNKAVEFTNSAMSKAFSALGAGPLVDELKSELEALSKDDKEGAGKAIGVMQATEDINNEDMKNSKGKDSPAGIFSSVIAYLKTVSNNEKLKDLCAVAACVNDPDVESCSPVDPLSRLIATIDGTKLPERVKKLMMKITVYPLVGVFASAKEAAVAFLGPAGRLMDSGFKRFETACDILTVGEAYASCIQSKLMIVSKFAQDVLTKLGEGKFVETLDVYDNAHIGKHLSIKGLIKCVAKELKDDEEPAKIADMFAKTATGNKGGNKK